MRLEELFWNQNLLKGRLKSLNHGVIVTHAFSYLLLLALLLLVRHFVISFPLFWGCIFDCCKPAAQLLLPTLTFQSLDLNHPLVIFTSLPSFLGGFHISCLHYRSLSPNVPVLGTTRPRASPVEALVQPFQVVQTMAASHAYHAQSIGL